MNVHNESLQKAMDFAKENFLGKYVASPEDRDLLNRITVSSVIKDEDTILIDIRVIDSATFELVKLQGLYNELLLPQPQLVMQIKVNSDCSSLEFVEIVPRASW
jgi:hypothetical protein